MENLAAGRLAYSILQLAQAVSVSRSTVYDEIAAGRLRTFKMGTRTLVAVDEAKAWLAALQNEAALNAKSERGQA